MKKFILLIITSVNMTLIMTPNTALAQLPFDTLKYQLYFRDTITTKFKPNFNVAYWMVAVKDTGSLAFEAQDSIVVFGETHSGDTVLCGLRCINKDTTVNIAVYNYSLRLPNRNFSPYQYFWVNTPAGLKSIWAVRINSLAANIINRRTWILLEALRKIY